MRFCYEALSRGAFSCCDIWQVYWDNPYPPLRGPPSPEEKASRLTPVSHGGETVSMFHGEHDSDESITSVLSPPPGENQRGGGSSGIFRYEHSKRAW